MAAKLTWHEPARYKRALQRRDGTGPVYWKPLATGIGIGAVCMFFAWYHENLVADSWTVTILICLVGLPALCVAIPLIAQVTTNRIVVSPKGITRSSVYGGQVNMWTWRWDQMNDWSFGVVEVEQEEFPALLIGCADNATEEFVLDPALNREELQRVIETNLSEAAVDP